MVIDALRRRAPYYWFLVMLLLPSGAGAVAYFIIVKMRKDFGGGRKRAFRGLEPEVLENLAAHTERLPSSSARLDLAAALEEQERYADAANIFGHVLRAEGGVQSGSTDALAAAHGLACCKISLGEPNVAVDLLCGVLEVDREFANCKAVLDCAEALHQAEQTDEAVRLLEGLTLLTERINHRLALAHYLVLDRKPSEAINVLKTALREYENAPASGQRQQRQWADQAEAQVAELASQAYPRASDSSLN